MAAPAFREDLESILNDRTSGSSVLVEKIEDFLPEVPQRFFPETVRKILATHPSMAGIINAVNRICLAREGHPTPPVHYDSDAVFKKFWAENSEHKNWITLSMSQWVIRCFKKAPMDCSIKVGISYPDMEGRETCAQLIGEHKTTLLEDTRLMVEIQTEDAVLIGADLITSQHIVNKTGSFALAQAAKMNHKPVYIISSGDKFLAEDLQPFYKIKIKRQGNRVVQYFERVPCELITKIFLVSGSMELPISKTMRGMTPPPQVADG